MSFEGDDFWDSFMSQGEVAHAARRTSTILEQEVNKRLITAGAMFMRAIGDAQNRGKTSMDIYELLAEGEGQSYSGMMMQVHQDVWNTLCYLTAPEDKKAEHEEASAFFRQICAAFSDAMDSYNSKIEEAPMLTGREDPDTGNVTWYGWAPWMKHEQDQMRWYSSPEEWWNEIWEGDE